MDGRPQSIALSSSFCNREDGANEANRDTVVDGVTVTDTPSTASLSSLSSLPAPSALLQQAIVWTLPVSAAQWRRRLFALCRHLQAIPGIAAGDVAHLRPVIKEWHGRATVLADVPFLDVWAAFVEAWPRVRVPGGQGIVDAACERAQSAAPPQQAVALYGNGPIVMLASICRELQSSVGNDWFYLDCRAAGRMIGVDHTTAWRYLAVMVADGILLAGTKGSKASGRASRFQWAGRTE